MGAPGRQQPGDLQPRAGVQGRPPAAAGHQLRQVAGGVDVEGEGRQVDAGDGDAAAARLGEVAGEAVDPEARGEGGGGATLDACARLEIAGLLAAGSAR